MKLRMIVGMVAAALLATGIQATRAGAVTIAADIEFYDALSPYGHWQHVSRYGDCWIPYHRYRSWRPYTVGYWVDTDYGWMWISQDPWGDIPYHYGRWAWDSYYGWLWVPDDELVWAPAWVSWRYSDSYVGWAPLPPEAGWYGSGLSAGFSYIDRRIPQSGWCFTPTRSFGTTRVRYSILPPERNVTIFAQTRNVTRYSTYNSMPAVRGPNPQDIQRASGRRIQRYQVADARNTARLRRSAVHGRTIEVYRPRITGVRERRAQFVPTGRGRSSREQIERRGQARNEQRMRGPAREEMRRQQQAEVRGRQRETQQPQQNERRRGYQRREQGAPERQGSPQYRERGQGQAAPQGQGQPPPDQRGRDRGSRGREKERDQGQGQQQQEKEKERGRGHAH